VVSIVLPADKQQKVTHTCLFLWHSVVVFSISFRYLVRCSHFTSYKQCARGGLCNECACAVTWRDVFILNDTLVLRSYESKLRDCPLHSQGTLAVFHSPIFQVSCNFWKSWWDQPSGHSDCRPWPRTPVPELSSTMPEHILFKVVEYADLACSQWMAVHLSTCHPTSTWSLSTMCHPLQTATSIL